MTRYQPSACTRRSAHHRATVAAGLPEYASDMRPVRGRCLKRGCRSRWAVVRVSIDFRDPARTDRIATHECAVCARIWRRVTVPPITSAEGYQAVRLTLILPATANRWFARGRWHREGSDGIVLRDATIGDLDEAARNHSASADRLASRKAAAKASREAAESARHAQTMDLLARLEAADAERAAAEREADDRAA
jgi:hypothetical protein